MRDPHNVSIARAHESVLIRRRRRKKKIINKNLQRVNLSCCPKMRIPRNPVTLCRVLLGYYYYYGTIRRRRYVFVAPTPPPHPPMGRRGSDGRGGVRAFRLSKSRSSAVYYTAARRPGPNNTAVYREIVTIITRRRRCTRVRRRRPTSCRRFCCHCARRYVRPTLLPPHGRLCDFTPTCRNRASGADRKKKEKNRPFHLGRRVSPKP